MQPQAFETLNRKNLRIGLCSRGIAKISHLDLFLQADNATFKHVTRAKDADIFIGWGNKASGQKAMEFAEQSGQPFLLLEDAFIRSYAPQSVGGEQALGLVLDDRGIYYDASRSSHLEKLIINNAGNTADGEKLARYLASNQISKYNNFSTAQVEIKTLPTDKKSVLVIDQTWRDQSISGAGANDQTFARMLEAAHDENPGQNIIVKLHPEVLAGKKKGYLKDLAISKNCTLLTANINPWQLFEHIQTVYTVSSQLGLDALMAGCKVRCFAMPFYAGWGLTSDESRCQRREKFKPSLPALVSAAYDKYARYKSAYDPGPCDAFQTAEQVAQIRDAYNQNSTMAAFYQVTPWKWQRVKQMFAPTASGQTFFLTQKAAINAAKTRGGDLVAWASRIDDRLEKACKNQNVKLQRLEDGFIRSVGLGTNFHLPMSLITDDLGIYYDPNQPSRLEHILQNYAFSEPELEQATDLIKSIIKLEITKYNLPSSATKPDIPKNKTVILVPGQVDNDASIILGGQNMTGQDLLSKVRHNNPDSFIIFKPHPDVVSGQRPGLCDVKTVEEFADLYTTDTPINHLMDACNEVHTISSLTGFEALIRNKKVHCYGQPFYAGWGLTTDHNKPDRRTRKLSVEMLAFATLIKYPRYYDPVSNLPCGPEQVIKRIIEQQANPTSPSLLIKCRSGLGQLRARFR